MVHCSVLKYELNNDHPPMRVFLRRSTPARLLTSVQVTVQVDHPGHQVAPGTLDHRVVGSPGPEAPHSRDTVPLDHHVHRPAHRCAVAVDDVHVTDQQALVALSVAGGLLRERRTDPEEHEERSHPLSLPTGPPWGWTSSRLETSP